MNQGTTIADRPPAHVSPPHHLHRPTRILLAGTEIMKPTHLDAKHTEIGISLLDGRLLLLAVKRELDRGEVLRISEQIPRLRISAGNHRRAMIIARRFPYNFLDASQGKQCYWP